MTNTMTKWGVGPRFTFYAIIYCLIMFGLTIYLDPRLKITSTLEIPYRLLALVGTTLIVFGVPFYLSSLITVMRAYKEGRLVTNGVYSMCRHPVYAAWIVFFVPSIALFINSWALLSSPFIMYLMARTLVAEEDVYLEETFGKDFLAYKQQVPAFLPYGWVKKKTT